MDQNERLELVNNTVPSSNKKLNDVLEHKDEFLVALEAFRNKLDPNSSFQVREDFMTFWVTYFWEKNASNIIPWMITF